VGPPTEQESREPGRNHVVLWGRVVSATSPTDQPPTVGLIAVALVQTEMANTRNTGKTTKSVPSVMQVPKPALVTKRKKTSNAARSSEPKLNDLVIPPQPLAYSEDL